MPRPHPRLPSNDWQRILVHSLSLSPVHHALPRNQMSPDVTTHSAARSPHSPRSAVWPEPSCSGEVSYFLFAHRGSPSAQVVSVRGGFSRGEHRSAQRSADFRQAFLIQALSLRSIWMKSRCPVCEADEETGGQSSYWSSDSKPALQGPADTLPLPCYLSHAADRNTETPR